MENVEYDNIIFNIEFVSAHLFKLILEAFASKKGTETIFYMTKQGLFFQLQNTHIDIVNINIQADKCIKYILTAPLSIKLDIDTLTNNIKKFIKKKTYFRLLLYKKNVTNNRERDYEFVFINGPSYFTIEGDLSYETPNPTMAIDSNTYVFKYILNNSELISAIAKFPKEKGTCNIEFTDCHLKFIVDNNRNKIISCINTIPDCKNPPDSSIHITSTINSQSIITLQKAFKTSEISYFYISDEGNIKITIPINIYGDIDIFISQLPKCNDLPLISDSHFRNIDPINDGNMFPFIQCQSSIFEDLIPAKI